jgi:hypothetical protein
MAVSSSTSELVRVDDMLWEIPADSRADVRVPARVFAEWTPSETPLPAAGESPAY